MFIFHYVYKMEIQNGMYYILELNKNESDRYRVFGKITQLR
jgi:hypothetical protein